MGKCRVYLIDPDLQSLSKMVPALADQGFEVAGSHAETDLLGKLDSGNYDLIISVVRGSSQSGAGPAALLLCRLKSSSTPIGILCPAVPQVMTADRPGDLLKAIADQSHQAAEAALSREISVFSQLLQAMDQSHPPDEIPQSAVEVLSRAISADQTCAFKFDQTGAPRLVSSVIRTGGHAVILKALIAETVRTKQPVPASVADSAVSPVGTELMAHGLTSALGIPVMVNGDAVEVVTAVFPKAVRTLDEGKLQRASALVKLISKLKENDLFKKTETDKKELLGQSLSTIEQRQREIKALNALLQGQHGRMKALEEKTYLHQEQYLATVRLLVAFQEDSGSLIRGHAEAVATWSVALAKAVDLPVEGLAEAAYLHDIGKAKGIRGIISQLKGGQTRTTVTMTATELTAGNGGESSREHPILGEEVARLLRLPPEWGLSIRHHHENYDGTGYPDGTSKDKIPVGARLIRLADAYVTYTQLTQGGKEKESGRATDYLRKGRGSQFDPTITDVLVKMLQKNETPTETDMLSTVSHELRSPLTYLVGYSELLASTQDLPDSAQQAAKEIYTEAQHMARIVDDMLDLSRIEAGHSRMNMKNVEVLPLIERAVAKARLKSLVHKVEADLPKTMNPVKADPDRFLQVLDNLLDNAIKYSPEGGTVKVTALPRATELLIRISDQGIGIPKDKLEVVFEKFQRLDTPLKYKVQGTGIGLNLCRRLVEAQGGRIWAESEEGKGSVLSFTLPVA